MKKLRYIFLLLIAVLSGFAISSCEDDDVVAAEVTEETTEGSGETVKTTFTISLSAPDVSADLDPVTRAGDNANIEYAKPENGGRFQNIVVVLVGPQINTGTVRNPVYKHKIYGTHFHNWNDGVGVKEYNVIFSDVNIDKDNDLGKDFMVYAFGNLPNTLYETLPTDESGAVGKYVEDWIQFYYWCVQSSVSVTDVYNINFKPGNNYTLSYKYSGSTRSLPYASSGMPVNNSATATVVKGNTQFNVALKRVCARLQVTFRNFTGTYKDYDNGGAETPNNVYVDKFDLKGILATSTNYFYSSSNKLTTSTKDFDILQVLGGSKTNDHIINKIENGKDLVVSMYVFENNKGGYQYDLKVDRGKSLGLNTTTIDPENAYVIWNNDSDVTNPSSISYRDGVIKVSRKQDSYDKIPFSDQVFWQFVEPSTTHKTNVFALKHYQIDLISDKHVESNVYLSRLSDSDIDWGIFGAFYNYKHIIPSPASQLSDAQYVQFKQESSTSNKFTMNLLNGNNVNREYWDKVVLSERHVMLTLCNNSHDNQDKNQLATQRTSFWNGNKLGNYDWTLYAKYIIKNGETFKDKAGAISQIERNHSYELDFSVMPNYEIKQEILVKCVRKQNEINWSEVEK